MSLKGVTIIKHLKNKRYWILMPPFLITTMLLFAFLPEEFKPYSFSVIIIFWVTYSFWNYYAEKKNSNRKFDN